MTTKAKSIDALRDDWEGARLRLTEALLKTAVAVLHADALSAAQLRLRASGLSSDPAYLSEVIADVLKVRRTFLRVFLAGEPCVVDLVQAAADAANALSEWRMAR